MLREIKNNDLETILQWRNLARNRMVMFDNHVIDLDEHLNWWGKIKNDTSRQYFIFSHDSTDYGVVCFNQSKCDNYWGFYFKNLDHLSNRKKIYLFKVLESEALKYAFDVKNFGSLLCEILDFNTAVIKMHTNFGFKPIQKYKIIRGNDKKTVIKMLLTKDKYYGQ
ncbi:MAG: GNAT family N-acetyltransferase [Methylococcales symbiont of Hymedesmia sp. n. MRB-2018]|nr:MAG: GNAT family N-acetyltransferase [Methylococcales symbiont of Hymedesmia sp. n. MRB-2018]